MLRWNLPEFPGSIALTSKVSFVQATQFVVGTLRFMSDINQPSLPTHFYSVPVFISVFMALSTVSHSINSPDNSPFSHSVLVVFIIIIIIYPLTTKVVGAPQMISQPVFSIFLSSPLPTGTWRTPGLSIPWCLPTSSSVCRVFFPLSLCLARWFLPDLMNGRHDRTTAVCVPLQRSGGLCVVWLPVTWSLYEMCSILR